MQETTVWTNVPRALIDTGRGGGGPHPQTVDPARGRRVGACARRTRRSEPGRRRDHAREGQPADVIIEIAKQKQADLIVVGSRGLTGIQRYLLGSCVGQGLGACLLQRDDRSRRLVDRGDFHPDSSAPARRARRISSTEPHPVHELVEVSLDQADVLRPCVLVRDVDRLSDFKQGA